MVSYWGVVADTWEWQSPPFPKWNGEVQEGESLSSLRLKFVGKQRTNIQYKEGLTIVCMHTKISIEGKSIYLPPGGGGGGGGGALPLRSKFYLYQAWRQVWV